jgi:curved DNA-binding protein CbpA
MPTPFETLGVSLEADDASLRARYLELIREFSPEAAPTKFAAIREAYELIGEAKKRAAYLIDPGKDRDTLEQIIEDYEVKLPRRRNTLDELIQATEIPKS